MKLTGKAKDDFTKWKVNNDYIYVTTYSKSYNILENALIIEWFDSVGIYINTIRNIDGTIYCRILMLDQAFYGKTRQEATEKAIEQANKIYNEKNT